MTAPAQEITDLLLEWRQGSTKALDKLMPLVYEELRRLAKRYMAAEPPGHTLETTAVIHEACLRLVDQKRAPQNRAHFLAIAAGHPLPAPFGRGWRTAQRWMRVLSAGFSH